MYVAGVWTFTTKGAVLILVVMDDALVRCRFRRLCLYSRSVLILVVMDDALVQQNVVFWLFEGIVRQKSAPKDFVLTNIMYLFCECKITKKL